MMREELARRSSTGTPETAEDSESRWPVDKIEAAKNVVMMDLALLQAEVAAGMYKKPIDVIAKEFRYDPLPSKSAWSSSRRGRGEGCCRRRRLRRWCRKLLLRLFTQKAKPSMGQEAEEETKHHAKNYCRALESSRSVCIEIGVH